MRLNMFRKPLFLEGVRLCCRPIVVIQSGLRFATSSGLHPLRPCTSSAASPCGNTMRIYISLKPA
jgi:hypothetical protein